jgi:hypothetical protein
MSMSDFADPSGTKPYVSPAAHDVPLYWRPSQGNTIVDVGKLGVEAVVALISVAVDSAKRGISAAVRTMRAKS